MKRYAVTLPVSGRLLVEVEAENEDEALDKAFEVDAKDGDLEWETHRRLVYGNVFAGMQREAEVELIEDDEDATDEASKAGGGR